MPLEEKISAIERVIKEMESLFDRVVKENEHIITEYISEDQMYEKGIGGTGKSLGDYSPVSIQLKKIKGQRTDHITGRDTGRMHNSLHIEQKKNEFSIEHDKEGYMEDFEDRYHENRPFDLVEENIDDFKDNYIDDAIEKLMQWL